MIIEFGHRTYFRANPKNKNCLETMLHRDNTHDRDPSEGHAGIPQYEDQMGYAIGREAIISVLPDCVGQDGYRSIGGQIETWNVFFLSTAAILTRFGKSIRLSAGWWGSY